MQCSGNILKPAPFPHSGPWENCLPQNWSLVPTRLGMAALHQDLLPSAQACEAGSFSVVEPSCTWWDVSTLGLDLLGATSTLLHCDHQKYLDIAKCPQLGNPV